MIQVIGGDTLAALVSNRILSVIGNWMYSDATRYLARKKDVFMSLIEGVNS